MSLCDKIGVSGAFEALNYLEVEDVMACASLSRMWREASLIPSLSIRRRVDFISSIVCEIRSRKKRKAPKSGKPSGVRTELPSYVSFGIAKFLGCCTKMRYLELPFLNREILTVLLSLDPLPPIRELHIFSSDELCIADVAQLAVSLSATLTSLSIRGFTGAPRPDSQQPRIGAFGAIKYLNLSGTQTHLPCFEKARSACEFITLANLHSIEELNLFDTPTSRCRTGSGRAFDVFAFKINEADVLSGRDFLLRPLRVNVHNGNRLPVALSLKCGKCGCVVVEKVTTYMMSNPQQDHITAEIGFNAADNFSTAALQSKSFNMITTDPPIPELQLLQNGYNCPRDCHEEDGRMIFAMHGPCVHTRGWKFSAAIGKGLCEIVEDGEDIAAPS